MSTIYWESVWPTTTSNTYTVPVAPPTKGAEDVMGMNVSVGSVLTMGGYRGQVRIHTENGDTVVWESRVFKSKEKALKVALARWEKKITDLFA